jgi:carboxyl-terminal processing protease
VTTLAAQAAALSRRPGVRRAGAVASAGLLVLVHQATFLGAATDPASQGPAALAEVRRLVLEQWVEEPDAKALDEAALRGLVGELAARGDPFSQWVPPDELTKFEEETSGQFGGLGILVNVVDGLVHVIAPIEDTPAWKAGILPGDIVLKIDGKDYAFDTAADAVAALKGAPGTTIALLVKHATGDEPPRTVELVRAIIQVRSVKGTRLLDRDAKIGYLRLTAFNAGTVDERGLILDLRGNPGGYLDAAARVADAFLPEGAKIVETRARRPGSGHTIEASGDRVLSLPVAILIDGGTASASEVLAGALADDGVATLVGSRSYGKG